MDNIIAFAVGVGFGILIRILWKKHGLENEIKDMVRQAEIEIRDLKIALQKKLDDIERKF